MNPKHRNLFMVVAAFGIATLACSPLGSGAAATSTAVPSVAPATQAATTAPTGVTGAAATATLTAATEALSEATATVGEATATGSEAVATVGEPSAVPSLAVTAESIATEATQGPTSTYDAAAAQSTVPPLQTALAATAAAATGSLRQWAASATASSQYGDTDWAASQAANAPDSPPNCSDETTAWAGLLADDKETLELTYTTTVVPVAVNIYESYSPGSIVKVDVEEPSGTAHTIYAGQPLASTVCPRTLSIGISGLSTPVNRVKIYFDQAFIGNWDEIDAVELVGNP